MHDLRNAKGQTLEQFLCAYDPGEYPRPSVTVDMAVFTLVDESLGVLLIKRKDHPCIGQWALPGGFLNMEESLSEAVERELAEETGVCGLFCRQFHTFGDVGRDPRTRLITVGYVAIAPQGELKPKAADDAEDAAVFSISPEKANVPGVIVLSLTGPGLLCIQAHIKKDALGPFLAPCSAPSSASLPAFDHAYVLVCALRALLMLPRKHVCALLAGKSASAEAIAAEALNRIEVLFQ